MSHLLTTHLLTIRHSCVFTTGRSRDALNVATAMLRNWGWEGPVVCTTSMGQSPWPVICQVIF